MIGTGEGLAALGGFIALATGILKFAPAHNGNGFVLKEVCSQRYTTLKEDLDEVKRDVKRILVHLGEPHSKN